MTTEYEVDRAPDPALRAELERLGHVKGAAASWMPEMAFVSVEDPGGAATTFTILRDSSHTNVMTLFDEESRRRKNEDALAVVPGFLGSYPNALFALPRAKLAAFALAVSKLDGTEAYRALRSEYGVLRTSERFWERSDRIQDEHRRKNPLEFGLLDYNRLEAY
jgi:hypothetical protein